MQPQQPEQPLGLGTELLVRPGEHGPHIGRDLRVVERVETTAFVCELAGQRAESEAGMGGRPGRHDAQREGSRRPG